MISINANSVFTLWMANSPSDLHIKCWGSWIRFGYSVTIYVDDSYGNTWQLDSTLRSKISIKHLRSLNLQSCLNNDEKLLHKIDYLRFVILNKFGGTWLDADMLLIKRLPTNPIIISSENTLQSGFKKSKELFKPNIGCLRFPPGHPFTKAVVEKMQPTTSEDENDNINMTSKMLKFIKMIKLKKWSHMNEYVMKPEVFCPVPWCWAKELYTKPLIEVTGEKYGLSSNYIDESTVAVHLWNNFKKNKFKIENKDIHPESLYKNLLE